MIGGIMWPDSPIGWTTAATKTQSVPIDVPALVAMVDDFRARFESNRQEIDRIIRSFGVPHHFLRGEPVPPSNPDHAGFMAAICERPDDDVPRLVYADWLDERAAPRGACVACQGSGVDPREKWRPESGARFKCVRCGGAGQVGNDFADRAEFIRVQCWFGQHGPRAAGRLYHEQIERAGQKCALERLCEWCTRRQRERELLTANNSLAWGPHSELWANGVRAPFTGIDQHELIARGYVGVQFTRGFVSSLTLSWADWTAHSAAILASCPITDVRLTTWPDTAVNGAEHDIAIYDGRPLPRGWRQVHGANNPGSVDCLLKAAYPGVRFELPAPVYHYEPSDTQSRANAIRQTQADYANRIANSMTALIDTRSRRRPDATAPG